MNSKFGDCCNCPALVDGRFFTEFRDRDYLQFNLMKQNNITNSNDFRNYLISNGANLIASNISNIETNYKCNYNKPRDQTTLAIDTSKYVSGSDAAVQSGEIKGYTGPNNTGDF